MVGVRAAAVVCSALILTTRIALACEATCGMARRAALRQVTQAAIAACLGRAGARACKDIARERAKTKALEGAVASCEDECDAERTRARAEAEIERQRPRNRAERVHCIRRCPGDAHLAFDASGTPYAASSGWCGTDAVSCEMRCAIR